MQATIRDLDGNDAGTTRLPPAFDTPYRPDLIKRAVIAAQANRRQSYGADPYAGKRTSAESPGAGRGIAMVPRSNNRARRVPQATKGRRAHPPKPDADRTTKINDKERQIATNSAIAATADPDLVAARGHQYADTVTFPVVVTDDLETLVKTKDVLAALEALGLAPDIDRADTTKIRAGRGTTRGRKYTRPTSILFVTGEHPLRAARNLPGATVATGHDVSAEDLAPGTHPGRLTLWTEHALEEVAER